VDDEEPASEDDPAAQLVQPDEPVFDW